MVKPDITVVAAKFEEMVGQMHDKMHGQRQEMLAGVDLSAFKTMQITGENQVAALSNEDMTMGQGPKGIA